MLLSGLKFTTEIPCCSRIFLLRELVKYTSLYGRKTKGHLFQDEHGTRCKKMYFFGVNGGCGFLFGYIKHFTTKCSWHYYKMQPVFYYKMRQKFIKKWVIFFITIGNSYYKMWRFYYKKQQLLQNTTLLQNVSVHSIFLSSFKSSSFVCFIKSSFLFDSTLYNL